VEAEAASTVPTLSARVDLARACVGQASVAGEMSSDVDWWSSCHTHLYGRGVPSGFSRLCLLLNLHA
jgi:hypothetical protein